MRLYILVALVSVPVLLRAQKNEIGWIAPEGRILNFRTLTWNDFQNKEDKEFADKLAEQNMQAKAYVCPAIYFKADSSEDKENGRVSFKFHVKCAFQSRAFVRESTKQEKTNYVLNHEQDHYDIALTYSNKLQAELSSRDYSLDNYNEEVNKVYNDLMDKYYKTQETYDNEVNPSGTDDKPKQYLWDMRIKKGLENNTTEFYSSPESAVQTVKMWGQTVKRIPGEPALQFAVRARPLYTELPQEMTTKVFESSEWSLQPAVFAFYTQKYYIEEGGGMPTDHYRTLGYVYVPTGGNDYRRILIDTFINGGVPVSIAATALVNADSDDVKELVVIATSVQKDAQAQGTLYINRVYDNITRQLPGKLKKLDNAAAKVEGGFEGVKDGKPSKAKCKSIKDVTTALK